MVLRSPFGLVLVVATESVLAPGSVHTSVDFISVVCPSRSNDVVVTIVSDLPSADHVAVDLLSPLPV